MSQQFGNPLMRFLRKVKARFTEREGTRGYQRRLERETRRVAIRRITPLVAPVAAAQ